ncbi:MAG: FAD-binding oxidoreductase [Bacteroidetes bacterium]|nr:FAD-binding oxidoreductase [Bacteroidota bacterium]
MQKTDFIIVGQGIAGSVLAIELIKRGKTVLVLDKPGMSQSSKAAGGIFNPVVFKRLTESWMAHKALSVMHAFFEELERTTKQKLVYNTKIARVFASEEEALFWKKKAANELADFISPEIKKPSNEYAFLSNSFAFVQAGGFVDVPLFLSCCRNYLQQQNAYLETTFLHSDIQFYEHNVRYQNYTATSLIFCEGYLAQNNPFFKDIKFKPAQGETLTLYCEKLKTTSILQKDFFVLPLPQASYFKVGATYNWEHLSDTTTLQAKKNLIEKIDSLLPFPYEITEQQAGVRPATIDRRPVMGFSSAQQNIGIFNGFGSKAIMLAPYFALHFCDYIEQKNHFFFDVDVKRFCKQH